MRPPDPFTGDPSEPDPRHDDRGFEPLVTFVLDDCPVEDYTVTYPILRERGFVATLAAVSDWLDSDPASFVTRAQAAELVGRGWEVASHTVDHPDLTTLAEAQVRAQLADSKAALEAMGFAVENLVYPYNAHTPLVRRIARELYRCGAANEATHNTPPVATHALNRFPITTDYRLADYTAAVDRAAANRAWLIFMVHSHPVEPFLVPAQRTALADLCDHIATKGVEVVTLAQGLDRFGPPA